MTTTELPEVITDWSLNPNSTASNQSQASEAFLFLVAERLFVYLDPVVTLVGLVGNILTFCIMQRPALRHATIAVYLCALAASDSSVLVLDFLNNWLEMGPARIALLGASKHFCLFHRYFFNISYTYSSWVLVAVAVERFIVVTFPLKAKILCTRKYALIAVISILAVITTLKVYHLFAWQLDDQGNCDIHPDFKEFHSRIGQWLTAVIYSYLPLTIIFISNMGIIVQLHRASRQRKAMKSENSKGFEAERKITIMVVVICLTFLLLTGPVSLWYVILFNLDQFIQQTPPMALGETIILILALSNHAINFFIYTLTSDRFRSELLKMFGYCTMRQEGTSSSARSVEGSGATMETNVTSSSGVNAKTM